MVEEARGGEVLLTGATGFVGRELYPVLDEAGYRVRCTSRTPEKARERWPGRRWVEMDVGNPSTVVRALDGCRSAYYLVHRMVDTPEFEEQEMRAAMTFLDAATEAGVERIVYLGGLKPLSEPARHLRSRLVTGAILRSGEVTTVELRASMIIGAGSASWRMVRDVATRLPVMLCPKWLNNETEPVAIADVKVALKAALQMEVDASTWFAIPGPDRLTFRECIERVCDQIGNRPVMIDVPVLTPRLSSYWLRFVTGVDYHLARALAEGLKDDLVAESDEFWERIGHGERLSYDEAVRRALADDPAPRNSFERAVHAAVGDQPQRR